MTTFLDKQPNHDKSKVPSLIMFYNRAGEKEGGFVYAPSLKEWFIYPFPGHQLIPLSDGLRCVRADDGKHTHMAWSWNDIKEKSLDGVRAEWVPLIEKRIAECEAEMRRTGDIPAETGT